MSVQKYQDRTSSSSSGSEFTNSNTTTTTTTTGTSYYYDNPHRAALRTDDGDVLADPNVFFTPTASITPDRMDAALPSVVASPSNTNVDDRPVDQIVEGRTCIANPLKDVPGNSICFNDKGNKGLTILYRNRRNFLFQNVARGKKRKAFTNDYANAWIQKEIIDYIMDHYQLKGLHFYNGELTELKDNQVLEAIRTDIENYTGGGNSASTTAGSTSSTKRKDSKIQKCVTTTASTTTTSSTTVPPVMGASNHHQNEITFKNMLDQYQELVRNCNNNINGSATGTTLVVPSALLSIFRAILNDTTLLMCHKELEDKEVRRRVSLFIEQAWTFCSATDTNSFSCTIRFVRQGENINLTTKPTECISAVKAKLCSILNISCENQCLTYKGIVLEDMETMQFYKIGPDSMVDLILLRMPVAEYDHDNVHHSGMSAMEINDTLLSNPSHEITNFTNLQHDISNLTMKNEVLDEIDNFGMAVTMEGATSQPYGDIRTRGDLCFVADKLDTSWRPNEHGLDGGNMTRNELTPLENNVTTGNINVDSMITDNVMDDMKWFVESDFQSDQPRKYDGFMELQDEWSCWMAAKNGNLIALQLARQNGCSWDERTCSSAAENNHLHVIQWAHENGCLWDVNTCTNAAKNGHLHVLKWVRERNCPWDVYTSLSAAGNGHLAVLQWALENGCPWDKTTCFYAAYHGYLTVLQWARNKGCLWDEIICSNAARNGHLHVLKWARENGCPWDVRTCSNAARNGHLHVLQWVRENKCPWDIYTCISAAGNGHLNVLQWAKEHGCPWDEPIILQTANENHQTIIAEWILMEKNKKKKTMYGSDQHW